MSYLLGWGELLWGRYNLTLNHIIPMRRYLLKNSTCAKKIIKKLRSLPEPRALYINTFGCKVFQFNSCSCCTESIHWEALLGPSIAARYAASDLDKLPMLLVRIVAISQVKLFTQASRVAPRHARSTWLEEVRYPIWTTVIREGCQRCK